MKHFHTISQLAQNDSVPDDVLHALFNGTLKELSAEFRGDRDGIDLYSREGSARDLLFERFYVLTDPIENFRKAKFMAFH